MRCLSGHSSIPIGVIRVWWCLCRSESRISHAHLETHVQHTSHAPGRNTRRKSNDRPARRASSFRPHLITIRPDEPVTLVCPDCGIWTTLRRGNMIRPHRITSRGHGLRDVRCPGSGQLIDIDLTPEQWGARCWEATADAGQRRSQHVVRKPKRPSTPAVSQMQAATAAVRRLLGDHQVECAKCQTGRKCETRTRLRQHSNQHARA
jgi:hypothetical protein